VFLDKVSETNALTVAYSLRNIFAPFVNYLTTALKETTIIAINAEYVVLQTMKGTDTDTAWDLCNKSTPPLDSVFLRVTKNNFFEFFYLAISVSADD
jgi:hypothetical protein